MNLQEYRNLQEAYLDVVENQQLDEISNQKVVAVGKRREKNVSKAFDNYADVSEKPGGTQKLATDISKLNRFKNLEKKRDRRINKESYDLYDLILSHLIDEGYADTQEAAERIMVNMSEEWRESIVEDAAYNTLKGFGYPGALVSAGLNKLSGGKISKPDQPTTKSTLTSKTPIVSSSGGAVGKVTVDKQYPATLNKEKGMKSTGETGTEYFTPNIRGTNITDLNRSKFKSVASQQYEKIPSDQASQLRTAVPKVSDQTKYDPTYKPISMRRPGNFRT